MALSDEQLYALARGAGLPRSRAIVAGAVAHPESGANPSAHNANAATGDDSYGLWQINMIGTMGPIRRRQFGISRNEELLEPKTNAKAMAIVSSGGVNFTPWTAYRNGLHRPFLPGMESAANRVEAGGPSLMQQILKALPGAILSPIPGVGGAIAGALPSNPLDAAKNAAAVASSFYRWLPGGPPPDPDEIKAAQHGLLRVAEVVGGTILVILALVVLLRPVVKAGARVGRTAAAVAASPTGAAVGAIGAA